MKFKLRSLFVVVTVSALTCAGAIKYRQHRLEQTLEYWLPDSYWEAQSIELPKSGVQMITDTSD